MSKASFTLLTPAITDAAAFQPLLDVALKALKPASVHLKTGTSVDPRVVQALAPGITAVGAALVIDPPDDFREVARTGADGVHISDARQLEAALDAMKPNRIVGAGSLKSKDSAMNAGEAGCDYLMFGEPRADASLPPFDQVLERCEWWASVFTVPCVGYAPDMASIAKLAATGVEFVALGPWLFEGDAAAVTKRCAEAMAALKD